MSYGKTEIFKPPDLIPTIEFDMEHSSFSEIVNFLCNKGYFNQTIILWDFNGKAKKIYENDLTKNYRVLVYTKVKNKRVAIETEANTKFAKQFYIENAENNLLQLLKTCYGCDSAEVHECGDFQPKLEDINQKIDVKYNRDVCRKKKEIQTLISSNCENWCDNRFFKSKNCRRNYCPTIEQFIKNLSTPGRLHNDLDKLYKSSKEISDFELSDVRNFADILHYETIMYKSFKVQIKYLTLLELFIKKIINSGNKKFNKLFFKQRWFTRNGGSKRKRKTKRLRKNKNITLKNEKSSR
jgi:hypothetical protein